MKLKNLLALLLSLALIFVMFAGCGSSGDTEEEDTDEEEAAEETEEPEEEEEITEEEDTSSEDEESAEEDNAVSLPLTTEYVEFDLFTGMNPNAMEYIDSMEECMVFEELETRTGIHINITVVHPSVQSDNFNIMIASGDYADMVNTLNTLYSGGYAAALDQDVIVDLSDYIDEYCPNYAELIESDDDVYRAVTMDDGSIGGFYSIYYEAEYIDTGLMVRSDWLDEFGMDVPDTYDDYYEFLKAANTEYGATFFLPAGGVCISGAFITGFDIAGSYTTGLQTEIASFYVVDGEVRCGWLQDEFKSYLEVMNQWYSEGLIDSDYISTDASSVNVSNQETALANLLNDEYAVWGDEIAAMSTYDISYDGGSFPAIPSYNPTVEEGGTLHVGYYTSRINMAAYSITTACEDVGLLCRWIDYQYSEEGALLCNWGIEDVTFVYDENGDKQLTDLILNNEDGMSVSVAKFVYLRDGGAYYYDRSRDLTTYSDIQMSCYDVWPSNYDMAYTIPNTLTLSSDEADIYNNLAGDILTYVSETINQFIVGNKPLDEYDDFVQTLKDLGMEEMTSLYQAAYDRYMAK